MDKREAVRSIADGLRRLLRAIYLDGARMNREYGVTGQQCVIMRRLRNDGPASSADLSRLLHVSPSNMTGLIDRLEKKGLVTRARKVGDRRVSIIELTEAGMVLEQKLPDPLEMKLESKLADLDPEYVRWLSLAMDELLSLVKPMEDDLPASDAFLDKTVHRDIANS